VYTICIPCFPYFPLYWEHDAGYQYYAHGPLAREVIGQRQVQGVDYAYTINDWLKAINSNITNPTYDMGHDGDYRAIGTDNAYILPP